MIVKRKKTRKIRIIIRYWRRGRRNGNINIQKLKRIKKDDEKGNSREEGKITKEKRQKTKHKTIKQKENRSPFRSPMPPSCASFDYIIF